MKPKFLFLLCFVALNVPAFSQTRGDLNGDDIVDVTDVSIMIDMVLGKQEHNLAIGDLDGNSMIDVSDVSAIIDIVLGKVPEPTDQTFTVNGVSFKMIAVDGGTFMMGHDNPGSAFLTEKPAHSVTLSGFSIGETEVTQALWQAVMGSNPSYYTGNLQCPVEQVTWIDCHTFLSKLNALTGKNFRLPTEAEWEFAARGGNKSEGYDYAGSDDIDQVAWYGDNSGGKTRPVATKAPNELGIYDMSGNVCEWCEDWSAPYSAEAQTNPTGPTSGDTRVFRGGSWCSGWRGCWVTRRSNFMPTRKDVILGLRIVL